MQDTSPRVNLSFVELVIVIAAVIFLSGVAITIHNSAAHIHAIAANGTEMQCKACGCC